MLCNCTVYKFSVSESHATSFAHFLNGDNNNSDDDNNT